MHTTETVNESKVMPSSESLKGMDNNSNGQSQEKMVDQMSGTETRQNDRQKKRTQNDGKDYHQNSSPRRNNGNNNNNNGNNRYNRMSNYHNGTRQNNRNNQQHRLDTNNNNSNNHKMQYHQNHGNNNYGQANYNNHNGKLYNSDYMNGGTQELVKSNSSSNINSNNQMKRPIQKQRLSKTNSGLNNGLNYDDYLNKMHHSNDTKHTHAAADKNVSDDSGINLNSSISSTNTTESTTRVKFDSFLTAGDGTEMISRKYTKDYLHQVKNEIMSPKVQAQQSPKVNDDANLMSIKMALGDNSGYYNHLYAGGMYTNHLVYQTHQQIHQKQQQYQQNYAHYQRMRMYQQQQDSSSFQRISQQQQQQQQQQQNSIDQRSYHSYNNFNHQSYAYSNNSNNNNNNSGSNSNNNNNNRAKQNSNRKNRHNNSSNNNSTNERINYNHSNKKLNDQASRVMQTKSENSPLYDEKRKNLMYIRTNSEECRSLSPTPPSSVKSSSPVIQEKTLDANNTLVSELNDDSESTTSSIRSVMSCSSDNKEFLMTPTILLTPSHSELKSNHVNSWIKNTNFAPISNGMSVSAEQLNMRDTPTITIIKRPPSANGISSSVSSTSSSLVSHSVPKNYTMPPYDPTYPFDYYYAKSERCEMREEPVNLMCGSQWDQVSHEIWHKFQMFQQTRETYRNKMQLGRELYEYIKGFPYFQQRACPKWGLFLVGSTISGFGLDSSDVDMCLVLKAAPQLDPRTEAVVTLSALQKFLEDNRSPFQGFYLINAKVPILRFRDATNTIEVDLNYNNCIGVRNTHLLYCYTQLDPRLRPLAIAVKLWAQFHNINDASKSTISSYSLVLMVIHFLQSAVSPPVLPCLHQMYPEKFQVLHDIATIDMMESLNSDWRSENRQPLGELFLRFLDYYSNFNFARDAISIRTGGVLPIEECRNVKNNKNEPSHWQTLCIEEPFDLTNTARSTYDGEIFQKIKNVFFHSYCLLRQLKTLDCLFHEPLFVPSTSNTQAANTQLLNDVKCVFYGASPPRTINSSPIITSSQMNSEITS